MTTPNEKALLSLFSAIIKRNLNNIEELKDGKILFNILETIIPINTGKSSEVSLKSVHQKLESIFNTTFTYIDIVQASKGNNAELEKIATLVLVAGTLSDCVQEFMEPIRAFNHDTRNIIKKLLNQAIQPNMDLESLSTKTNKNKTFFKELDITSPSSADDFKLASLISPTANPFTPNKDISFNTKMLQTEERLDILSFKLKTEKQLRCNIEEEIFRKENEIDRRVTQIKELSDLLKETELRHQRGIKNLKSELLSLQEDLRISENEVLDSKTREKNLEKELTELKEMNSSIENHNNVLSQEICSMKEACEEHKNKLQELSTLLLSAQSTEQQLSMKEDELKVKSQEIEKLKGYMHVVKVENQHEMEILKSKLQELHEKLNKSMDEGECWGDVVEMKLNDDIENLQTQLQKQCDLLGVCEKDKLCLKSMLDALRNELSELKSSHNDKEKELSTMTSERENLLIEQQSLNDLITSLKEEHFEKIKESLEKEKSLLEEKELLNENIEKFKEEVSTLKKKNFDQQQSIEGLEEQLKQTRAHCDQLEIKNKNLHDQQEVKNNELSASIQQCENHLSENKCLTEEITSLKDKIDDLVRQEEVMLKEKEFMSSDLAEMKVNISNLEKKCVDQQTLYCDVDKQLEETKVQIATYESHNEVLKREKEAKNNELSAMNQQYEILCSEKQNLKEEMTSLKTKYEEKITELNKKEDCWLEEKALMNIDITKLKEEFTKLKQKIKMQQSSYDELEKNLKQSQANLAILTNQYDVLKQEKDMSNNELSSVTQQNQTLLVEKQSLKDQIASLKKEFEVKIIELERKNEELSKEKEIITVEINNMRIEFTKFEKNNADQQNSYSEIEEQLKVSEARIVSLQSHNDTLQQEKEIKDNEISTITQQKDNLLSEKQNLNEQLSGLKEEFARLVKKFLGEQTLNCEIEKKLEEVKVQLATYESHNEVLKGEKEVRDNELDTIIQQKEDLLTEKKNLNEQLDSLKEKHEKKVAELVRNEEDLMEEKEVLNLRLTELKEEVSRLEEKSVVQEKSLGEVEEELKQTKVEMETIERHYNILKQEKDLKENELSTTIQENKALMSEKKNLIEKITILERAFEEKIIELERREKFLLKEKEERNEDMNKLKDTVSTLEKINADKESSHLSVIEQLTQAKSKVANLQAKNTSLQEQLQQDTKSVEESIKTQQKDKEILENRMAELIKNESRLACENKDLLKKVISMQGVELKLREELNVAGKKQQELYVMKEGLEKTTLELNSRAARLKEVHERKMNERMKDEEIWNDERKQMKESISSLELTTSRMKSDFNKLKKEMTKLEKTNEIQQRACVEIEKELKLKKTEMAKLEDENKTLKEQRDDLVVNEIETIKNDKEKLALELKHVKSKESKLVEEAEKQQIRIEEFEKRENLMFSYMDDIKKSMEYNDRKLTQTKEFVETLEGRNRLISQTKDEEIDSVKKKVAEISELLMASSDQKSGMTDSMQKAKKLVSKVHSINSQQEGISKQTSLPELNSSKEKRLPTKKPTPKVNATTRRMTRSITRKDGSWNNYGAPTTLPSQDIPIITYTSKSKANHPPLQASAQKAATECVVFSSPEVPKPLEPRQALPKGYLALFPCQDEPEEFEWGQLTKQSLQDQSNQFKIPTIENIPKKMTKSQDSKIRRDTYCLDRVVEEKDQNLKGEDRLEEILRRNSFYLPHLKSSYPLEELHLSAKDIQKLVESPVDPMGRSNDDLTYVARGEIFRQAVKKIKQSPLKRLRKSSLDSPITKLCKRNSQDYKSEENVAKKSKGRQLKDLFSGTPKKSKASETDNSEHKTAKSDQENVAFDVGFTPKKVIQRVFKRNNKKKPLEETADN